VDKPSSDFEELFRCLNARSVSAIIVGGHALAFHGRPRFTNDLDVFVEPTESNAEAWQHRVAGHFGGEPVFYLGRDEFIRNKQAVGRPQDLADLDALI